MKRTVAVWAPVLLLAACAREAPPPKPTRVLFIGNSLSGMNDLPGVFAQVARSLGASVEVAAHVPGGSTSTSRVAMQDEFFLQNQLPAKSWDYAVLQEASNLPSAPAYYREQELAPYVQQLSERIRGNDPRTRLAYLVTWGYKDGDVANCGLVPETCSYGGMQDRLIAGYVEMATAHPGILVPVGQAWRRVRREHPTIELYADDHHPSGHGTYLAACVVYATLFRRKCTGAAEVGLEKYKAAALQEAADATVFDPQENWYQFNRHDR